MSTAVLGIGFVDGGWDHCGYTEGGAKNDGAGVCCGRERLSGLIRMGLADDCANLGSQSTVGDDKVVKHNQGERCEATSR